MRTASPFISTAPVCGTFMSRRECPSRELAAPVDSVNVCFSKGLGAPVGSAVAGSREFIDRGRRARRMLGGAMRQVGILAAAAIHALDHIPRLAEDHANAQRLARGLASIAGIGCDPAYAETNIVGFDVRTAGASAWVAARGRRRPCERHGLATDPRRDASRCRRRCHRSRARGGARRLRHVAVSPADLPAQTASSSASSASSASSPSSVTTSASSASSRRLSSATGASTSSSSASAPWYFRSTPASESWVSRARGARQPPRRTTRRISARSRRSRRCRCDARSPRSAHR